MAAAAASVYGHSRASSFLISSFCRATCSDFFEYQMGPNMTGDPYVHSSRCSLSLSLCCMRFRVILIPPFSIPSIVQVTERQTHHSTFIQTWDGKEPKSIGDSPPPHASFHSIPIFIAIQTRSHLLLLLLHQSPAGIQMLQLTNENASYYISILAKYTQHDTTGAAAVAAAATATTGGEKSLVAFCFFQEPRLMLLLLLLLVG